MGQENMAVVYGVRSPPKFMVEILGSSFKFSTSTINFTAEFKILHSSFRFYIIGKHVYTRLLAF